ncbi:MAG: murein biosynthesis integral membrane protein MurJ [Planctomycetaceae bacterium]|nr:murein biosynthesis integral membrane protein MurJ [Planctomycetaceae bacterium]
MSEPESKSRLAGLSTVSLLTLCSRFTGMARDALMASLFSTGWILDAFSLAFRLPNTFRRLFGEGAMTAAFLPQFVRADQQYGRAAASDLFSAVGWRLIRVLLLVVLAGEGVVAAAYLGLTLSDRTALLCQLTMILLPFLLLICLSGFYAAALNGVQHFFIPALVPVVLNVCWLCGGIAAVVFVSADTSVVQLICAAIVAGSALQLLLLAGTARRFRIRLGQPTPSARQQAGAVFRSMLPVLIGLSITQVNALVDNVLALGLSSSLLDHLPELERCRLPEGTAGAMYLGQRLFQFPMGVVAVALGTVLFPRFAKDLQEGNLQGLSHDVVHGLQLVLVIGLPATIGLWVLAAPITDLLFRYQNFDAVAAQMTSEMVAAHGLGVVVFSGLLIINRVFYAAGDQMTPMRQGLVCVGLNLMFDVLLLPIQGATALPCASILATCFQLGLAIEVLRKRFLQVGRDAFLPLLFRVLICATVMTIAVMAVLDAFPTSEESLAVGVRLLRVAAPVAVAVLIYGGGLLVLGVSPRQLLKTPFLPAQRS